MNNSERIEPSLSAAASTGSTPAVLQSARFSSISSSAMETTTTNRTTTSIHESLSSQTATMTITQQNNYMSIDAQNDEVLPLTLRGRLAVTWYVH